MSEQSTNYVVNGPINDIADSDLNKLSKKKRNFNHKDPIVMSHFLYQKGQFDRYHIEEINHSHNTKKKHNKMSCHDAVRSHIFQPGQYKRDSQLHF